MKSLIKVLAIFIAFSFIFSSLSGCTNSTATKTQEDTGSKKTEDVTKKTADDEYPEPPERVLKASFEMLEGGTFNVEENKGKVVLINLWANWCLPCIKEMPHLNALQEKYKDKDFIILGLNTGNGEGGKESKESVTKFVERHKLNYKIGWSDKETTGVFFKLGQSAGIPQSFLISRSGKLRGVFKGGSDAEIAKIKKSVEKVVNES